jgi:TPR repeat protein
MALVREHITKTRSIHELQKRGDTTRYFNGTLNGQAAENYFLARAKDGDAQFQFHLGMRLASSDPQSAIAWLRRAGDQGCVTADFQLGMLYERIAKTSNRNAGKRLSALADQACLRAARQGTLLAT